MRFLTVCILLFASYTFNACSICSCKKVPCNAFEDVNFQTWFASYQTEQKIVFKCQSLIDTLNLTEPSLNEAYEASQGCYHGSSGCHKNFSVRSNQISFNSRLKFSLDYFSETAFGLTDAKKSISLWLNGFDCKAVDVNDQGLVLQQGIYNGNYASSLLINGVRYDNVQTITRDTLVDISSPMPFKVYLGKGLGIIGYETYPAHELWVKQ